MKTQPSSRACGWCGKRFTARRDGGKEQRFCSPACRHALDAAGRRWVAKAIAGGTLTLDGLRNGAAATRALPSGAISPAPVHRADKPASIASAESPGVAEELLNELLYTLLVDLPDAWSDLVDAVPDELFDRIDRYLDNLLFEPNAG